MTYICVGPDGGYWNNLRMPFCEPVFTKPYHALKITPLIYYYSYNHSPFAMRWAVLHTALVHVNRFLSDKTKLKDPRHAPSVLLPFMETWVYYFLLTLSGQRNKVLQAVCTQRFLKILQYITRCNGRHCYSDSIIGPKTTRLDKLQCKDLRKS